MRTQEERLRYLETARDQDEIRRRVEKLWIGLLLIAFGVADILIGCIIYWG